MDNLQYICVIHDVKTRVCFKPYYKWITFNTRKRSLVYYKNKQSFKPYYKWITFNTLYFKIKEKMTYEKSFKPYYKWITFNTLEF